MYDLLGNPYGFPADVREPNYHGPELWTAQMAWRWREFAAYDVLHVHYGLLAREIVYPVFTRLLGTCLAVHLHGDEARTGRGLHYLEEADAVFASTPDIAEIVPAARWLPNPIDVMALPRPAPANDPPRFGHFPSSPERKGTADVVACFRDAFPRAVVSREPGREWHRSSEAELVVASGIAHGDALDLMAACDVVIDQISTDRVYAMVSIEAMALGKPAMSSLRPDRYPGCPVVPIDRGTGAAAMRWLATDEGERRRRGHEGQAYVARTHDPIRAAKATLAAYARDGVRRSRRA